MLLRNPQANWRRFLLVLSAMLCRVVSSLTNEARGNVLIINDSSYDRQHSRQIELPARLYDHAEHRFIYDFRILPLDWYDGSTFLSIDFAMLSSTESKN